MSDMVDFLRRDPGCTKPTTNLVLGSGELDRARELHVRMYRLREIINRRDIRRQFVTAIAGVFKNTEAKRKARTLDEMIHHLVVEWRLAGTLPVLVMGSQSNPKFENFFFLCCEMMPAIDMIQDARCDYRDGQISVRPSLRMYLKLLGVLLLPLPKLFMRFPKPSALVKYTVGFLKHVYWDYADGRKQGVN